MVSRRQLLQLGGGLTLLLLTEDRPPVPPIGGLSTFSYRCDHVLGTSMNLLVRAESYAVASHAWREALDEVEQFDRECSGYRAGTALSALNQCNEWVCCGPRLLELLRSAETATTVSGGAVVPWIGGIASLWRDHGRQGTTPDGRELEAALDAARATRIEIAPDRPLARRVGPGLLNLDAIGKSLAVDRVAIRLAGLAGIESALVEIGGDIRVAGNNRLARGWPVAIADPRLPFDNAPPLAVIELRDAAVCTSGPTRRADRVGGGGFSHILSPFDGTPVARVRSASVVAPTATLANALSTAGVVLGSDDLLRRCARVPRTAAVVIETDNAIRSSPGLVASCVRAEALVGAAGEDQPRSAFRDGWQVQIALRLPKLNVRKYRRPYVAVWIEDAEGKPVRTLTVWGNEREYLREMTAWWRVVGGNRQLIAAVTRATRPPGEYKLAWDGKRDDGSHVAPGVFTICVEVNREFGQHLVRRVKLSCLEEPANAKIPSCGELEETLVHFGPVE